MSNTIEENIISAYDDALSNYLHAHWPFRHTDGYGVDVQVVDDDAGVNASGYLGKDNHDDPCSFAELQITTNVLHNIGIDGLIAGNRVILHAICVAPPFEKAYRSIWAEQSRGYSLKIVSGYYIRGHFVETDDKAKAYRIAEERELKIAA